MSSIRDPLCGRLSAACSSGEWRSLEAVPTAELLAACACCPHGRIVHLLIPAALTGSQDLDAKAALGASRCLLRCARLLAKKGELAVPRELPDRLLAYVWANWDHFVEAVRLAAVDILSELLAIHQGRCSLCVGQLSGECVWLGARVLREAGSPSHAALRGRYLALRAVAKRTSASSFFKLVLGKGDEASAASWFTGDLMGRLSDGGTAHVAAQLYVQLATAVVHQGWDLRRVCLRPLFAKLRDGDDRERRAVRERFLPRMLAEVELAGRLWSALGEAEASGSPEWSESLASVAAVALRRGLFPREEVWEWLGGRAALLELLSSARAESRLAGWALLSEEPRSGLPLGEWELDAARLFLHLNAAEQEPALRKQVLAGLSKLLVRLRDSCQRRSKEQMGREVEWSRWLLTFALGDCQRSGANFGRRTFGLAVAEQLLYAEYLRSGEKTDLWAAAKVPEALEEGHVRSLLQGLNDTYDSNQEACLGLLRVCLREQPRLVACLDMDKLREDSTRLLRSNRPQDSFHGVFLSRLLSRCPTERQLESLEALSAELEAQVELCEAEGLGRASEDGPMYGVLAALAAVAGEVVAAVDNDAWSSWLRQTLTLADRASEAVRGVVHSMSPEGYLPPDFPQPAALLSSALSGAQLAQRGQILLVVAWRSQKEVSNLLHTLLRSPAHSGLMTREMELGVEDYFWTQLTECKHRGAFETAYEGFLSVCQRLWAERAEDGGLLRAEERLSEILSGLSEDSQRLKKLAAFRRSAGLPFLVVGLLVTEPRARQSASLAATFEALFWLASGGPSSQTRPPVFSAATVVGAQTRVHAMNVLKVVFKETGLGEAAMGWVARGFEVSLAGFDRDEPWSVRNSASQLFAAVLIRTFGVGRVREHGDATLAADARTTAAAQEFFARFPSLLPLLRKPLEDFRPQGEAREHFGLFPGLILLGRLHTGGGGGEALADLVPLLLRVALHARILNVRALAAAAIRVAVLPSQIPGLLAIGAESLARPATQNALHGALLVLHRFAESDATALKEALAKAGPLDPSCWSKLNVSLLLSLLSRLGVQAGSLLDTAALLRLPPLVLRHCGKDFVRLLPLPALLPVFSLEPSLRPLLFAHKDSLASASQLSPLALDELRSPAVHSPSGTKRAARFLVRALREGGAAGLERRELWEAALGAYEAKATSVKARAALLELLGEAAGQGEERLKDLVCAAVEAAKDAEVRLAGLGVALRKGDTSEDPVWTAVRLLCLEDEEAEVRLLAGLGWHPPLATLRLAASLGPPAAAALEALLPSHLRPAVPDLRSALFDPIPANIFAEHFALGDGGEGDFVLGFLAKVESWG